MSTVAVLQRARSMFGGPSRVASPDPAPAGPVSVPWRRRDGARAQGRAHPALLVEHRACGRKAAHHRVQLVGQRRVAFGATEFSGAKWQPWVTESITKVPSSTWGPPGTCRRRVGAGSRKRHSASQASRRRRHRSGHSDYCFRGCDSRTHSQRPCWIGTKSALSRGAAVDYAEVDAFILTAGAAGRRRGYVGCRPRWATGFEFDSAWGCSVARGEVCGPGVAPRIV